MATKTWIGTAGAAWATSANWSPSGIPASADDIVFTGDASPTISTTARTCANLTINGGTVSIGGTAAFTITGTITNNGTFTLPQAPTIQGSIVNNGYMETTTTAVITVSGGNFQTWALGSHNFHAVTLNKTTGTELRLDSALQMLRATGSTFSYTAGNLNQNGNTISCRQFTENGTTARTWNMNAVVDITPSGTAPLSINDTTITFSAKNTFTISPQSGTAAINVSTVGGAVTAALAATSVRANHPSIALYTNLNDGTYRSWVVTGFYEQITINGNFNNGSYFGYWTDVNGTHTINSQGSSTSGSEVSAFALLTSNNTVTWNYQARIYRMTTVAGGVAANTVLTNAQFTNYAWNWWDGGPIGRAIVYDLNCSYATHNLLIDGTQFGVATPAYTLNCGLAGTTNNSTYNLEYVSDGSTSNNIVLACEGGTYNCKNVNSIGTVTHTRGTVQLSTDWQPFYTRIWTTSGGNRHYNFAGQYIVINGNHRTGVNGTGTLSASSQTAGTTLTSDSPTSGGGFLCQTNGSISIGTTWAVTSLPHITIESLNNALLSTTSTVYARTLTVNNAVSLGTGSTVTQTTNITHGISWNGNSPVAHTLFRWCNLIYYGRDEDATIDCRPYNDPTNVNYRFNTITATSTAGTSTVNWYIYTNGTFIWQRPGGTCNLKDIYALSYVEFSQASGTSIVNITNDAGSVQTTALRLYGSGSGTQIQYNINGFSTTGISPFNTSVLCNNTTQPYTANINYTISNLNLSGANTSNMLQFNGGGQLTIGENVRVAYFSISDVTYDKYLNFGTNWIYLKTGAVISVNGTKIINTQTTPQKHSFSGAGGFRVFEGNTGGLTTSNMTESNAFNLLFEGAYTATLSGLVWRNIVTSTDSYFGGGGGYFTNAANTFTIYGDLLVRSGEFQTIPTNWALHTFNLAGTDSTVPQFISNSAWGSILPFTTVSLSGASPKVFNQWAHDSGSTYIKTLTTDIGTTLVVHKDQSLVCDTINVGGGNFDCYGTIYCNRWNPTGNTYYWTGSGYLDVGTSVSFANRGGPSGWTASTVYNTNSSTAPGTGPNFKLKGLDIANEGSTISYGTGTHKVKNLLISNNTSVGGTSFSVSRGIIYSGGNLTTGGTVSSGNYSYNPSVSSYEGTNFTVANNTTFTAVTNFCSILWNLPPADGNTYYFEWTNPAQTSSAFIFGVQDPPTRQGNYHGGTTTNGNGGAYVTTGFTSSNTWWMKINTSARTYTYGVLNTGSGTTVSFSSLANPQYFGIYDGTSSGTMTNITMNFGASSWTYPAQQSGNYYLGTTTQAPPVLNFETGIAPNNRRFITTNSNMTGIALPITVSSSLNAELDILPTSQNLKVNTLAFNANSTIRTNSRTIETTAITSGTLELDSSNVTITGSDTVFNNTTTVSGTPAANNYSYYFDSTNAITIAQTSANAINITNSPFTLECWLWPEENYGTPWVWPEDNGSSNTATNPRLSLITKSTSADPRNWSRDWEFALQPYTAYPQFYNGTTVYTSSTSVNEDSWNHLAVTFTGAGLGMTGGGGGQDGASLFDGKPEYRGRSGYTVGNTAIAPPQTLPVTNFWSNYFDGTDDRINIADSAKSHVGSSAFTIELWIYNTAFDPSGNMLFEKGRFSVGKEIRAYMTATQVVFEGNVSATATGAYTTITATTTNLLNTWYHVAFIRSGNTLYIFRNGSLLASGALTGTIFNTTEPMTIGPADGNNNYMINGYVSNFRLITGQALTTTSYTVPTSPLTKTSTGWAGVSLTGTVALLTCNSNKFVDNSDNPVPISFGGGIPQITSFSPFGSTYNGSVVFNNANYITIPYSATEALFTTPGTYTWTAPAGVTSVNAVTIGGGGGSAAGASNATAGGGGGGLGWKNNIPVVPGQTYTVVVGAGGQTSAVYTPAGNGGTSYFINTSTVAGFGGVGSNGGSGGAGGSYVGDGGGNGGLGGTSGTNAQAGGGGGAGGYSGNGGNGGGWSNYYGTGNGGAVTAGSGGGGGGGGAGDTTGAGGGGGGVGLNGQGANGTAGFTSGGNDNGAFGQYGGTAGGGGGSNGTNGGTGTVQGLGGVYGGGAGSGGNTGGNGGVRLIWGSTVGSYPNPGSSDLDLSTGEDWTIECLFTLPNVTSNNAHSLMGMSNGAGQVNKWLLNVNMSTGFGYQANRVGFVTVVGGVNQWINSNYTWQSGKWYHIAAVYTSSDTSIRLYVNGLSVGLIPTNVSNTTGVLRIGADGELYRYFNGYIKDARVVKGTAIYQAAAVGQVSATPIPTQPLTAVTNTKLLVCQGNGYFDSNTQVTAKTITIAGAVSPRIEEVSPFYTWDTTASNSFIPSTTLPTTIAYQGPLQGGTAYAGGGYGGAGGGGYWGGSAGGYSESNTMGGGGGGSNYVHPTLVTSSTIYNGYYTTAGNASDADRGTSGNGGSVNTVGQDGKLIIIYGATTLTYSTAQFDTAWTCPAGVTSVQVKAWGAGGAGGTVGGWGVGFPGGAGACVTGTLSVTPGVTYYLTVGGAGQVNGTGYIIGGGGIASRNNSDNRYGSSGGGLTGIFTASPATQTSALLIAGGGGGGGSSRNTQQLAIYLNGTSIFREATMTNVAHTDTTQYIIGKYITGYLKDVRIVKNAVVYNGTFTTPTSPLGIHSEGTTELLTCQTNAIEDLSTIPKTIASSGTTIRRLFSPTAIENTSQITFTGSSDATAYITGNMGSIINNKQYALPSSSNGPVANSYSVLHDGLTQQSTLQAIQGTQAFSTQTLSLQSEDFTIECWLYPIRWNTMGSSGHTIATTMRDSPTYGWAVSFQQTNMQFTVWGTSASSTTSSYTFSLNTWYHLVWQRTSSGMEFYINGQLVTNDAPTNRRLYSGGNDSAPLSFGTYVQNLSYRGNGSWRVSNFRIVKNATVYNSGNFTPILPTVTANTVFLGLNTDTFIDQAGTIPGFTTIGTAPVILGNQEYEGTGKLILPLTGLKSNYGAPIINSVSIGAGSYAKLFKFSNAGTALTNSEGLNANLYTTVGGLWNNTATYYMSNFGDLGSGYAHGPMVSSSYTYTRTELPAHTHIRYKCYWHFVASTDSETSWLEIDGTRYLEFTKSYTDTFAATTQILRLSQFSFVPASYSDTGGLAAVYQAGNGYFIIDTGQIAHTSSSVSINNYSGVNQARTDEAAYLSHVELILYNNGVEVATVPQPTILNVNNFSIDGNVTYQNWLLGALKQPSSAANMVFNYLNIRNSQVSGGLNPYWTAANSTDYGLNSGWNFGGAGPISVQDKSFFFFIVT